MLREWRRVVGVWKETTQTRVHHLKKTANPKSQVHPGTYWGIQGSCSWNHEGNHPQTPFWRKTGSKSTWYYPGKKLPAADENALGETPLNPIFYICTGRLWITCANESSKVWLMRTIRGLWELMEGVELTVVDSKNLPRRPKVLVRIPDTSEVNTVMTRLRKQNTENNTSDWSVMSRRSLRRSRRWHSVLNRTHSKLWSNQSIRPSGDWEGSTFGLWRKQKTTRG